MQDDLKEALSLLQEECAEVIQSISKIDRFGIDSSYKDVSNREALQQECADVLTLLMYLMVKHPDVLPESLIPINGRKKILRLQKYCKHMKDFSGIYD